MERSEADASWPWASWALLAATLLGQLAALGSPELWLRHGIVPAAPSLSGLVAHLFLHAGWLPLLGTLGFLALAGPWLEAKLGRALFLACYLASGLAGATLFVATHPDSTTPWIGGSAAIAGLLGALLAAAGRARIDLGAVAPGLAPRLLAPAWALAAFWLGRELAGLASDGTSGLWSHVGSFGFGAALALGLRKTGVIEDEVVERDEDKGAPRVRRGPGPLLPVPKDPAQLEALLGEGTGPEIARAFLAHAEAQGRLEAARSTAAKRLWEAVEWRRREPAVALWCALVESGAPPSGGIEPLLQLASWLRGAGHAAEGTAALHVALAGADAAAAAKIARTARRAEPVIAYRAAERALEDTALAASDRKALEGLLVEAEREIASRGVIVVPASPGARPPELPPPVRLPEPSPEPAQKLRVGEAIEIEAEPEPVPVALPDPERAGDAAFLDAFHAALSDPAEEAAKSDAPPLRRLRVREALPRKLEDDAIVLEVPGRDPVRLRFARIHAVTLVGVRGLSERAGDKPVLVVDLCLSAEAEPELSALRLRSDRFDPRRLSSKPEPSPLKALRSFATTLATRAHAALLPEGEVAGEVPLRIFRDLESYQREVLRAR